MEHLSVLKTEVGNYLKLKDGDVVIDATLGLGGHAKDILKKIGKKGRLIAFEQDGRNLNFAKEALKEFEKQIIFIHDNFRYLKTRITEAGISKVDAILFDLGLSSPHIDDSSRGFSFSKDGPLDMRFDQRNLLTAEIVINTYKEEDLADIFFKYGEERMSRRLAKDICERRKIKKFDSTVEFADAVERLLSKKHFNKKSKINPATKIFQAIRIEVNDELNVLKETLKQAVEVLNIGGKIAVISYHSLEDRIVKQYFNELKNPPASENESIYRIHGDSIVESLIKKPVIPTEKEIIDNPRSRSAKLRCYKKLKDIKNVTTYPL